MSKISWSEFIIVWLTVCVVIDMVFSYLSRKCGKEGLLEAEERKAKIKQLNTPYREDVAYETQIRRASMVEIKVFAPDDEMLLEDTVDESSVRYEDDDKQELTELQEETSDIVKMLFG